MKRIRTRTVVLVSIAGIAVCLLLIAVLLLSAYKLAFGTRTVEFVGPDETSIILSKDEVGHSYPPVEYESGGYDRIEPLVSKMQEHSIRRWRFEICVPGEEYGIALRRISGEIEAQISLDEDESHMDWHSVEGLVQEMGMIPTLSPGTIYAPT